MKKLLFLSYSWDDKLIADELESYLKTFSDIKLIRDIIFLNYGDNISEFMQKIKVSDFAIVLLSKSYVQSRNCMFELIELSKKDFFITSTLFIFIGDCAIFKMEDRIKYVSYWENTFNIIKEESNKIPIEDSSTIAADIKFIKIICLELNEILRKISQILNPTYRDLKNESYKQIDAFLKSRNFKNETNISFENRSVSKKTQFYQIYAKNMLLNWQFISALEAYEKILKLQPDDDLVGCDYEKCLLYKSWQIEKNISINELAIKINFFISLTPEDEMLFLIKSMIEFNKDNIEGAINLTKKAVDINPSFYLAYIQMGYYYNKLGKLENATNQYMKAIEIYPDNPIALNNAGYNLKIRHMFDKSISYFEQSIKMQPTMLTLINIGDAYRYIGLNSNAIYYHNVALKTIQSNKSLDEGFYSGQWIMNYFCISETDNVSFQNEISLFDLSDKTYFLYISLLLDCLFSKKDNISLRYYKEVKKHERWDEFKSYLSNQLEFIINKNLLAKNQLNLLQKICS